MRALVVGQSKTGTTALLAAVSGAIGEATTHFEPATLRDVDPVQDDIAVKRLLDDFDWAEGPVLRSFDHRFLIYRDPRDRFISWLLYDIYGREVIFDDELFGRWVEVVRSKILDPASISMTALNHSYWEITGVNLLFALGKSNERLTGFLRRFGDQFRHVRYEDFVAGNTSVVSDTLGVLVPSHTTVTGPEARVARTKSSGGWSRWFTERDIEVFRPFCTPLLREFGYDDDWTFERSPTITMAESIDYIHRLRRHRVDEREAELEATRIAAALDVAT